MRIDLNNVLSDAFGTLRQDTLGRATAGNRGYLTTRGQAVQASITSARAEANDLENDPAGDTLLVWDVDSWDGDAVWGA